jgi:hypothetical protein
MSEEVTTHQIKGVCEGVMMKGDWLEFHIDIGRQYPVKLSTKQPDVKAAGQEAGKAEAVWTYTERDGNPNPHKPGEFFKNRYLSKVEVGGTLDPALAGQQRTSNAQGGGASGGGEDPRGRSIERQAVVKAALVLYPSELLTTDAQWFDLIERVHVWVAEEKQEIPKPQGQAAPTSYENPDDDIPF